MKSVILIFIAFSLSSIALAIVPPQDTIVAENGQSLSGQKLHYLVKSGVSVSAGGIDNKFYVENGGKVDRVSGIDNTVYAETGAVVGRVFGSRNIVYENQIIGDSFKGGWVWLHDSQNYYWSAETGEWYYYFSFWYGIKVGDTLKIGLYPSTPIIK